MWNSTTREQHTRKTNRHQTALSDEEWRVIEAYLPATNTTGRPTREIINGIST
jgi:hypothetical protein